MNKKSAFLLAAVVAVLLIISYCYFGGPANKSATTEFPPELPNPTASATPKSKTSTPEVPAVAESAAPSANAFLPTNMEDPKRFELLQKSFKEMGTCLNMKTGPFTQNDDMNFETLNTIIAPDLGEVVTSTEDWSATDIKTNSGEIRRIFIQQVPNAENQPVRTLKYYAMTGGGQKELPLSKEQSANPSETLIASLESDGQLVSKSVARKVYYQNGDDLSVVERNGRIYSFELAHDQKTFKCSGVDSSKNMTCSCK